MNNKKREATVAYWEVCQAWNHPAPAKPMTLEKALSRLNFAKEAGGLVAKSAEHLIHQIVHKNVDYPPVEKAVK